MTLFPFFARDLLQRYFGNDYVHLTSKFQERRHQLIRLVVNTNPTTVHKNLRRTVKKSNTTPYIDV